MLDIDLHREIQRIKNGVILRSPFYASLLLELEIIPTLAIPTAETDGTYLWFNPEYTFGLPFDERMGLFAHEAHHCGANHHTRIGSRDEELANEAGDYAINLELLRDGFKLPKGFLIDRRFEDMAFERIYNILLKEREQRAQQQKQQGGNGKGQNEGSSGNAAGNAAGTKAGGQPAAEQPGEGQPGEGQPGEGQPGEGSPHGGPPQPGPEGRIDVGGCGSFMAPKAENGNQLSTEALSRERARWDSAVRLADSVDRRERRSIGKEAGRQRQMIQEQQPGSADWKDEMREFMWRAVTERYSWLEPDYRIDDPYIPSRQGRRIKTVAVGIDTSASVSSRQLSIVKSEFNAMLEDVNPERVVVVFWDAIVQQFVEYDETDYPVDFSFPGRGGTVLQSFMQWIEANDIDPTCTLIFSDMEINDWGEEPDYPVLWGDLGKRGKAPYGTVIDLTGI